MTDDQFAKTIWDYMHMNHTLEKADAILVLGSHDTRVAEYAAQLFLDGWAPYLICSGGLGRLTEGEWKQTEAETFGAIAEKMGVPKSQIILEDKSTNTGENARYTKQLLEGLGMDLRDMIVVQKPYMERRTFATFKRQWPELKFIVSSPHVSFEEYPNEEISKEKMINIMVGDLQRIQDYPAMGFQIEQEIPKDVLDAYEELVAQGFTMQAIR